MDAIDTSTKHLLSMTLHPSEWYVEDCFVSVLELTEEVSLAFRVSSIRGTRVFSSKEPQGPIKDGWFTSINNRSSVVFAVRTSALRLVESLPIRYDWTNLSQKKPKNWGTTYEITKAPIRFVLESRFKPQMEEFQKEEDNDSALLVILLSEIASIEYF